MKQFRISFALLLFLGFSLLSQAQTIFDLNEKLGRGINYGNMFEAPSETAWGNPWQDDYPEIISNLGFNHVRIPIRWEPAVRSSAVAPYTIEPAFLTRIKEVVDKTLENNLMAIVNMHHHEALYEDPAGNKARFLAQWEQISAFFKDYSEDVVFEIMNEPHGNLSPTLWNEYYQDALEVIRVDNPTRAVLIGTADYGGLGGLPQLELPEDDDHVIVTIHYYNPFPFTHQGAEWVGEHADEWVGTEWLDTDLEREVIENEFSYLKTLAAEKNIPVNIGEFGAYSKADLVSREKWTTFLGRYFEEQGWSWAYWEFSAGFGIYEPNGQTYVDELVNALIHNEMPEPATYERTTLYQSDFSTDNDGWSLAANNGASAQLNRANNALSVNISSVGSQNWHIQLSKNGFSLQAGKKYSYSFTGSATDSRATSCYLGKSSDPWTQYSSTGATLTTTEQTFSGVLDMTESDGSARMVFDLGSSTENVTIKNIKVEELEYKAPGEKPTDPVDPPLNIETGQLIDTYPNPNHGLLNIQNSKDYHEFTLVSMQGHVLLRSELSAGLNTIDLTSAPKGLCLGILTGHQDRAIIKVLNQ